MEFDMRALFQWEMWFGKGYSSQDLAAVVGFIRRKIIKGERKPESLRLHNLIDLYRFADDLTDARDEHRQKKVTPRDRVLAASGREEPKAPAKTAAQVIAEGKAFEDFKKWRSENGL